MHHVFMNVVVDIDDMIVQELDVVAADEDGGE